ncbi:DmsC/YnfH family molybdoenzyme membrane anchor subunit [Brevibacillus sp. SYSU BS000544]|uniref:DmsC/YnfH family molybdoenzyme membrane anchor subunit n=1 Tax=Brevibacillus sp. SYSU BS000544 TaxID=3416443 RepID=UPI003CE498A0
MEHAVWDFRVTLDLFLGGLGIGLFLLSVLLSFNDNERSSKLTKGCAFLSPVLLGVGLLFLISELGKPERFITTMYRFNPQSVTSWGGVFQGAFVAASLAYAWLHFKDMTKGVLFRTLQVSGSILAIMVGVYHGLLLASLGRPLWMGGMIPVLFLVSSLLGATSLVLILKAFISNQSKGFNFTLLFSSLTAAQLVLVIVWQITLFRSGLEPFRAVENMMEHYGSIWNGVFLGLGLLIPLLASAYFLITSREREMPKAVSVLVAFLVIAGSFTFKHIVLAAGQISLPF